MVVKIHPWSVTVTAACRRAIDELRKSQTIVSMTNFVNTYGFIYPCKVQLGGRLQCIHATSAVNGESVDERKQTLLRAARAIFNASGLGETRSSHGIESLDRRSSQLQLDATSSNLSWEARGGNTLLGSEYVQDYAYSLAK